MNSIRPVADFSRKPAEYIKRLKETGRPEILAVNGKAEVVIQDAKTYEEMISLIHSLCRSAIAKQQHDRGEAMAADEAFNRLSEKLVAKYPNAGL